jgi:hypothetical protein
MDARRSLTAVTTVALLFAAGAGPSHGAAKAKSYTNCTALHQAYAHAVGRQGAHDKTSGSPVTNFKVSNSLYAANDGGPGDHDLDRDNDGVACEKR